MSLKRQLFLSFIVVAALPLIVVACFLYFTDMRLAGELYKQNLYNSTEIQSDIIEEHIHQFMVRAKQFASSRPLQNYMSTATSEMNILANKEMAREISNFTDNTLDSVLAFGIKDSDGNVLYRSGSISDSKYLEETFKKIPPITEQTIFELPWENDNVSLIIATPIDCGLEQGLFLCAYSNDYFLKTISSHRQIKSSNSFIYCTNHHVVVRAKQPITDSMENFTDKIINEDGSLELTLDGIKSICSYKRINRTNWVLVNSLSVHHIQSSVLAYIPVSALAFLLNLILIILLSRRQSKLILLPMNELLKNVEDFFLSGAKVFVPLKGNQKNEIKYLGDRFIGMAANITNAQNQLNESNYLYQALLHATYEFLVTIDLENQIINSSSELLNSWFESHNTLNASEKLLYLFENSSSASLSETIIIIKQIIDSTLTAPWEIEACFDKYNSHPLQWYRIIVVPIINDKHMVKAVLHFENITDEKREQLRLLASSQRDPLCGLLNKQAILELALKYIGIGKKNVVFFIDLDNFKQVNDTLGHAIGDSVLLDVSHAITKQFRDTDLIGRYGGDEFVVFAPGMSSTAAKQKAQALLESLSMYIQTGNIPIHVTSSIGVYISVGALSPELMMKYADKVMYTAKQKGKFQYAVLEENL